VTQSDNPTLKEIQDTIEEYLHITENDKCSVLKSLKINKDESLKKFNYKYKKLYIINSVWNIEDLFRSKIIQMLLVFEYFPVQEL